MFAMAMRGGKSLRGAIGLLTAGLLAAAPAPVLAQIGQIPPAATGPSTSEQQAYIGGGTPRAPAEKPAEVIARERAEFEQNTAACEAGNQVACGQLGRAYELGQGVAQVRPIASILYSEACQSGDAVSCYQLGLLKSLLRDRAARVEATRDFQRACELGSSQGCLSLARALTYGTGIARNPSEAERMFRLLCDQRTQNACRALARFLETENQGGAAISEAINLYIRECEAGDVRSCNSLSIMGQADKPHPDLPHPARVQYLGCTSGDGLACVYLGNRAMRGDGVEQDQAYGLTMYDLACSLNEGLCQTAQDTRNLPIMTDRCNNGDFAACTKVGTIYEGGNTVYSNDQAAFNFFAFACENGQFDACQSAGIAANTLFYAGATEAFGRSQPLFEVGCNQGDLKACFSLANGLVGGTTMPQNKPRAYELFAMLCETGDRNACDPLEQASTEETDIPLALAGAVYGPPLTEEEEEALTNQLLEERRAKEEASCDINSAVFRGQTYFDKLCDSAETVVKGRPLRPGQAPWQALLWRPERVRGIARPLLAHERVKCGGAVIERGWILTAAHCLVDQGESITARDYRIRLGVHNPREDEGVSYPILAVYAHDKYRTGGHKFGFDIALIRYDTRRGEQLGETNSIAQIAIDAKSVEDRVIRRQMSAYVYGWGLTGYETGTSTAELLSAKLQLLTLDECTESTNYRDAFLNSALCGAGRNGEDTCSGDSGGPLIYYDDPGRAPLVIGVVSHGYKCGTVGTESRYTRVAAARDWIDRTMSEHE